MTKTTNYQLNQWEKTDRVMMDDFNADNTKIDTALKANADTAAAASAAVARCGNGQIVYGTYTGSGTYGSANPVTLNFDHKPIFALVQDNAYSNDDNDHKLRMMRGITGAVIMDGNYTWKNTVSWGDTWVRWYSPHGADTQFNTSGSEYHYMALLAADE